MVDAAAVKEAAPAKPAMPSKKSGSKKEVIPAYMQPPFAKQITRNQAMVGKLLEDQAMVRVLRGASSNDIAYAPNFESQSHSHNLGAVRRFGDIVGRIELHRSGTRSAAQGTFPSNWRPTAPPNDSITRPSSAHP